MEHVAGLKPPFFSIEHGRQIPIWAELTIDPHGPIVLYKSTTFKIIHFMDINQLLALAEALAFERLPFLLPSPPFKIPLADASGVPPSVTASQVCPCEDIDMYI